LLRFEDTPARTVGKAVTGFTIVALLAGFVLVVWQRRTSLQQQ
jgi:hypothetical protein